MIYIVKATWKESTYIPGVGAFDQVKEQWKEFNTPSEASHHRMAVRTDHQDANVTVWDSREVNIQTMAEVEVIGKEEHPFTTVSGRDRGDDL